MARFHPRAAYQQFQIAQRFPEVKPCEHWRKPCPVCATPVQRIVRADNECNYCPRCQTGGRVLADRALSRLLHKDWPRTVEELEEMLPAR